MRICSLLPSGTEILYALGLGDQVVGVSHECDYPPDAQSKPKVVRTHIEQERASSDEIDQAVRRSLARGESLYQIDADALTRLRPDLLVTQELCEVCAIGEQQVSEALRHLSHRPQVISLHPHTLEELLAEIPLVGERTGRRREAEALVGSLRRRIARVREHLFGIAERPSLDSARDGRPEPVEGRPRVVCLEWLKPPMASGHWVPEMVELAGGTEALGRAGLPSRSVTGEEVAAARPEVVVLMPCGFSIARTRAELPLVTSQRWWRALPAVRTGRVFLVNGPAYFNRSGPRLVDGIELLAGLLHPGRCAELVPAGSAEPL